MHYLALLKGINVGTSGRIRMDALKRLFEEAGFFDVVTYIQSGNVLFQSDLEADAARDVIERALKQGASITTTAVLRSSGELAQIIRHCPFTPDEITHAQAQNTAGESLYVCLLPQTPDEKTLDSLRAVVSGQDVFRVFGREVYLLLQQSIRTSKLAIRLQKLVPNLTVRNWNTMQALYALASPPEGTQGGSNDT